MKHINGLLKFAVVACMAMNVVTLFAAQDVASAVEGSVKKIDAAGKVVVVAAKDGAEHTFHFADDLAVHTGKTTAAGTHDALKGIAVGSKVAVHYTAAGAVETAQEIDKLGDDGLKVAKGTAVHVDRAAKTVSIKTADGAVKTFDLASRAAKDTSKDVAEDADKAAKVSVYYTEDAGKKTAHFIAKAF